MTDKEVIGILEAHIECNKLWVSCEHDCSTEKCESCKLTYAKGNMREQRECFEIAVKAIKMRENIQSLIDEYQHKIELISEDLREGQMKMTPNNVYMKGRLGVYAKAVKDLEDLLNADEQLL